MDPAPLELLQTQGFEVIPNPYGRKLTEQEIILHLQGVDGLLAGLEPLNETVFKSCPQLKAIAGLALEWIMWTLKLPR